MCNVKTTKCIECNGKGIAVYGYDDMYENTISYEDTCDMCLGEGIITEYKNTCEKCNETKWFYSKDRTVCMDCTVKEMLQSID